MLRRYPRELIQSMRMNGVRPMAPSEFASLWSRAVTEPGPPVVSWLGHATVLVRVGGKTILTDPVLSHRIGFRVGPMTLGMGRLTDPPVQPGDLPPIDIVVISHPHFDHLDRPTLRALASPKTTVITARSTARLIPRGFGAVHELDWGQDRTVEGISFKAMRPAHWGARAVWDRHRGYNAYLIDSPGGRVLFAGDTAHTASFGGLGPVNLAIFGIGAYDPWIHAHANPEQVWSMFRDVRGELLLPVHHSTFRLSEEPPHEPMQRLLAAAGPEERRVLRCVPGDVIVPGTLSGGS